MRDASLRLPRQGNNAGGGESSRLRRIQKFPIRLDARSAPGDFVQSGPNLRHHGRRTSAEPLTEKSLVQDAQLKHERDRWPAQVIIRIGFNQNGARKTKRIQLCREWNEQNRGKFCGNRGSLSDQGWASACLRPSCASGKLDPEQVADIHPLSSRNSNISQDAVLRDCHSDNSR